MDRTYIESQKIVARYLSGDLSVREARQFEKYCLEHPDLLNSLPIPVRVKTRMARKPGGELDTDDNALSDTSVTAAGLDDSAADDDDRPANPRAWRGGADASRRIVWVLGLALASSVAIMLFSMFSAKDTEKALRAELRAAKAVQLRAAGNVRTVRVTPGKSATGAATVSVGVPDPPQWVELVVDMSEGKYNTFLVTLDDVKRGRVMQVRRVARDSNGEVRVSLNSSAFGTGDYDLKLEGYTWRGETVPMGWIKIDMR
jgi:hypothetical protein